MSCLTAAVTGLTTSVERLHGPVEQLGGQQQHDKTHHGSRQPQHQTVLHLLQDVHQQSVGTAWNIFRRLEASTDEVDGGDDDQCDGGRTAGSVASSVTVRQSVNMMQQVDEAEQHRALRPHQSVVDERVQQHEHQPTTDQHALAARRPEHPVHVVLERTLQRLDDGLRLGTKQHRGGVVLLKAAAVATVSADAKPAPAQQKRQRDEERQEQLGEPNETVLE